MTTRQRPTWLDRGRIPSLDGLRAIAILLVLFAHGSQTHGSPIPGYGSLALFTGSIGVEIFFVLSGFLITLLMLREIDRTGRLDVKAFYWRRILRIVPAYLTYLFVLATLQWLGVAQFRPAEWIAGLTYTVNFLSSPHWEIGHVWSLSIEEHFYLIWPAAMILLPTRHRAGSLVTCLGVCLAARWIILILFPQWVSMAELWTFTRLDSIAAGCLTGVLAQDPFWRNRLDRIANFWPLTLMTLFGSLFACTTSTKILLGVGYSLNSLCLAVLIWTAVRNSPNWLNLPFLCNIGVGSYSLYLWQQIFLNPRVDSVWTAFPQNLAFAGLAAWISYQYVERPFLRLKERTRTTPQHENPQELPAVHKSEIQRETVSAI